MSHPSLDIGIKEEFLQEGERKFSVSETDIRHVRLLKNPSYIRLVQITAKCLS